MVASDFRQVEITPLLCMCNRKIVKKDTRKYISNTKLPIFYEIYEIR